MQDSEGLFGTTSAGNFYGTTVLGGKDKMGVVFKLAGKKETVLYSFTGLKDGGEPRAGLIQDGSGNLYGTAWVGGDLSCDILRTGCGVVFELVP